MLLPKSHEWGNKLICKKCAYPWAPRSLQATSHHHCVLLCLLTGRVARRGCHTGRDIEDDEPMKRNFNKKNSRAKLAESSSQDTCNNGGDKDDRMNEAVPVTKEALLGGILQSVSHYDPLPEGAGEDEDEIHSSGGSGSSSRKKGKEKKEKYMWKKKSGGSPAVSPLSSSTGQAADDGPSKAPTSARRDNGAS